MSRTIERWNSFKRLLLVLFAILMWIMSIVFSYMGFKSGARSEWYFGVMALIFSGAITSLELHLNSQTFDVQDVDVGMIILWIGGVCAYLYGIWTNIIGISIMMLGTSEITSVMWQTQIVPILAGLLLETLPEPMFVAFLRAKVENEKKQKQNQQQNNQQPKYVPPPLPKRDYRLPSDFIDSLHRTHKN